MDIQNTQSKKFMNFIKDNSYVKKAEKFYHGCLKVYLDGGAITEYVGNRQMLMKYFKNLVSFDKEQIPKEIKTADDEWVNNIFTPELEDNSAMVRAVNGLNAVNIFVVDDSHVYGGMKPSDIRMLTTKDLKDVEKYVNDYPKRHKEFVAFEHKYHLDKNNQNKGPEVNLPTKIFNLITENIIDSEMPTDNLVTDKNGITSIGKIDDLIIGCNHYVKYYSKLQSKRTMYDYTNIKVELYGLHHVLMYLKHLHKAQIHNIYIVNWMRTMVRPLTVKDIKKRFGLNGSDINKFVQWLKGSAKAKSSLIKKLKI